MKIAVIGGAGFIGGYVVGELVQCHKHGGHQVVVFDLQGEMDPEVLTGMELCPPEDVTIVKGDVRDAAAVAELIKSVDGVIHLATASDAEAAIDDPRLAFETDIQGSLNVFKAASEHQVPVVYVSELDDRRTFGKAMAEDLAHQFNTEQGGQIAIVRPALVYGRWQPVTGPDGLSETPEVVPSAIYRALTDTPIDLPGGGTQECDWVHVEDVASVIVTALISVIEMGSPPSRPVEIGRIDSRSVHDMAYIVARAAVSEGGKERKVDINYLPAQAGKNADTAKADTETLWQIGMDASDLMPLEEGIPLTVEHYAWDWLPDKAGN